MAPSILSLKGKPGTRLGTHRKILSGPHAQVYSAGLRDGMERNLPLLSRFDTYRQRGHGGDCLSFFILTLLCLNQRVPHSRGQTLQAAPVLA